MVAQIQLEAIGTFATGVLGESAAEIPAYDSISQRLFVVNANSATLDVLNLSDPTNPNLLFSISPTEEGVPLEEPGVIGGINSVAVSNGIVAAAVEVVDSENDDIQLPGQVFFYNTEGNFLNSVTVGALPDMLTFTPDGTKIIVANEGEPGGDIDPEGSISIIDISGGVENLTDDNVSTADFTAFNGREEELRAEGVRIFPNKTVAPDLEPEYIAVSPDGSTAFVTLQENNAFAVVDIATRTVTDVIPLGVKDHDLADNGLDGSDRDNAINIQNYPIFGLYQPDGITSFEANGNTYYITANEGDSRDEDERIGNLTLDLDAFPNAEELQSEEQLGRLEASTIDGDLDGDGDFDRLFVYGGRSFSIWDGSGNLVFDSGDDFEQIIATQAPLIFNSNGSPDSFDSRSDNKGPEPENVVTGVIGDRTYAFIGLERVGGIMVYDVTEPANASFVQYVRSPERDISPEGLVFIAPEDSPNNQPLLVVANEVSGTTTIFVVDEVVINEIRIDQSSNDNDEYFELAAAPGFSWIISLMWLLVMVTGVVALLKWRKWSHRL